MKARAPKITETQEHKTIASYFRKIGLGGGALAIHIRNERGSAWERIVAKQMGVMSGIPDWLILHNGRAGFIELKPRDWWKKKEHTSQLTKHEAKQIETQKKLRDAGCWIDTCETLDHVLGVLRHRGIPLRTESISAERIRNGFLNALNDDENEDR